MEITDEMVEAAREAYAKQTGAEKHQLDGWIDDALCHAITAALDAAPKAEPEFAPDQWWIEELRKHWGSGETTPDTRRAANVALDFVASTFSASPKAEPVGYVTPDAIKNLQHGGLIENIHPAGTLRPENEIPLYATPPAPSDEKLREALERIAKADPRSTNSWSAQEAFAWCAAVANAALKGDA